MLSVLKIYGMLRAPLDVIKILMRHICVATTRRLERDSVRCPTFTSEFRVFGQRVEHSDTMHDQHWPPASEVLTIPPFLL